ncbi:tannase/feruloyl esterase family alpha/beta hydrolase [Phaeobacter sp. C3_T13_0]|uniref:tannase/feruloyl esterase family alpha/beta hydrolase n=1 Tax=Phaeobacter cretensis TaxID=3342641 RepID=UPI0039BCD0AF
MSIKSTAAARIALAASISAFFATTASADLTDQSCEAITDFAYPDLRIESAQYLQDAIIRDVAYPPHCRVLGFLEERTGTDGKAYATGFDLRMPQDWNDRFFFQGGGGTDGSVRNAVGTNTRGNPDTLTLGYAVASTDGGHNFGSRSDASFGLERKALIDYGYNSVELVSLASKALIREAYGRHAKTSYFLGASNGGRQGLQAAMRHPNMFDGIVAGTPIKEQTRGHLATAWSLVVLAEMAPKDDQGRPILSKAFPDADIELILGDITTQCDGLDGLDDGVVDSARLCNYDISTLICDAEKGEDCITPAQATAFSKIHEGPVNSKGEELYAPMPYDGGADFKIWHIGDAEEWPNNGRRARNQSIKMVFRQPGDPNFDPWSFDFDDLAAVENASQFVDAKSPDIDAFVLGGGKLILYHAMGDSGISAIDTTRWFETLLERYGVTETAKFAQFYQLPGLGHGRLGIGPSKFPALEAIVAWVEEGQVPEMQISGGTPERTRPMCPYPTFVTWNPSSENWDCQD